MTCQDCGTEVHTYRQCPKPGCGFETGYCKDHGGDPQSVAAMVEHIKTHQGGQEWAT